MLRKHCATRAPAGELRRGIVAIFMSAAVTVLGVSAAHSQTSNARLITLKAGGFDAINSATPFFVAQRQGFFKDAGLDVAFVMMAAGAASTAAALRSGELDLALEGASQGMTDIARGVVAGKIIGEFTDNNYVILAGNGITDPKQFKGKIFGISSYNGGDQLYAEAVLSHYGISTDDVSWLPIGIPASRLSALETHKVDGIEMVLTSMPDSAKSQIIVSADDSPVPFVSSGIFATQKTLAANKPALQKFLAAIGKGADWIRAHPDDSIAACADSGASAADCKVAIQVATTSKNPYTWSSTARVNVDAIKDMIPIVAAVVPQAKNMTVTDFVDSSIAAGP